MQKYIDPWAHFSHGQNAAPGATSGPQSYFCGSWPVTLGRACPQKAQCSSLATYGGTVRMASHIGRRVV